jgi:pyrroloquinoline quinone (PQQ) biosynthesis protein C
MNIIDIFLEDDQQLSKILHSKNSSGERGVHKSQYQTLSTDLKEKLTQNNASIQRACGKSRGKAYFTCKVKHRQEMIKYILKVKGQCEKAEHHRKRCTKFCDALLNYLQKDINNSQKSYQTSRG